jgi:hypothetical protein
MARFAVARLAFGGVMAMSAITSPAYAEDATRYCREYARAAIEQSRAARQIGRCRHYVRDTPARWTLNYSDHFNWCKSVYGSGDNASERRAREDALNECRRG